MDTRWRCWERATNSGYQPQLRRCAHLQHVDLVQAVQACPYQSRWGVSTSAFHPQTAESVRKWRPLPRDRSEDSRRTVFLRPLVTLRRVAAARPSARRRRRPARRRAAKRAGVSRIRLHDLRHTAATLLLQAGVHPKVVSERLGPSSVMITLDGTHT
ncbi:MAG TPA: tyrosine-type recombinase/integrase [Candidatus Saccharimonadales bacterium]|nr:tyrosine-type recombinase/integrase [Candidatus Saccharimonadales bacterium]